MFRTAQSSSQVRFVVCARLRATAKNSLSTQSCESEVSQDQNEREPSAR